LRIFFIYIALIMFTAELSAEDRWSKVSSPTSTNLKNVFFINNNTGWISGDSGRILKTTNSGNNWVFQNSGVSVDIISTYFINERLGWALGWEVFPDSTSFLGTRILKTTNGGTNWISYMYSDSNYFMKTIYFLDSAKGFMGGAPISIVYTTDAGISWRHADTDTTLILGFPIEKIKFINPLIGYAAGGFRDLAGTMWRTTNGGLNWLATIVGPEPLNDLYIFNTSKVIAAGGDFEYGSSTVVTRDQGVNWFYDTLGTFGVANSIDFRTASEGWISLGIAQKFVYTLYTGNTWTSVYTPDSVQIYGIDFSDSLHGWAVGYSGAILQYNYGALGVNNFSEITKPDDFSLEQNYPNPFNPLTILNYELRVTNYVKLKIYDVLGNEVISLIDSKQNAGKYSITFDGTNFPSGVYFYELKSGNYSQVKKMLLLK
jgi:photosystem II stability/assembly factor-like uncharacterized protein